MDKLANTAGTASITVFETALGFVAIAWSESGLTRLALPERSRETAERRAAKWAVAPDGPHPEARAERTGPHPEVRAARTGPHPEVRAERASTEPPFVLAAIDLIRRYAEGETVDFTTLPFDLDGVDPFRRAIYAAALKLGQGEVVTYGELAERAGFPKMARETGAALGRNPLPLVVPCHRIVAAGGRIGGFSAPGGSATKERLLAHEGVRVGPPEPAQASFGF